jgi:hypothetical protein
VEEQSHEHAHEEQAEPRQAGEERVWKCGRCRCDLVTRKVVLDYMGYSISHDLPVCPKCGKVYVSKELAEGRMCEVEQTLEDK